MVKKKEPTQIFMELAARVTKRFKKRGTTKEDITKEIKAARKLISEKSRRR